MKKYLLYLVPFVLLFMSCTPTLRGPFIIGNPYGAPIPYGEKRHPGIDFNIDIGTPVIAATDSIIIHIGESAYAESWSGGIYVITSTGGDIATLYSHLSKIAVTNGQSLKRGQLIGWSGASNNGYPHLHFSLYRRTFNPILFSNSFNPDQYWLDGKAQCFERDRDYAKQNKKGMTLPVACGDYAKELLSLREQKKP
ncbi:MAG: M23 family metallopeptidase [Smithellaceae bacterium]